MADRLREAGKEERNRPLTRSLDRLVPRPDFPRSRPFGTAATTARHRFSWLWGRDSVLRLGLSLILAVALWLYVTSKQNPGVVAYSDALQVATEGLGIGLTVTNTLPLVHLQIRIDNGNQIVTPANFRVYVNLSHLPPGTYPRAPVHVDPDAGIHVASISPATVPVQIERIMEKSVPLHVRLLVAQPRGYGLGTEQLSSSTITVSGPQSIVSTVISSIIYVNLGGVTSTVSTSATPILLNSQGAPVPASSRVTINPPSVTVTVPVKALTSYKTVPVLVHLVGRPKVGYGVAGVSVTPNNITAFGSPRLLAGISTASTSPVSVAGHGGGQIRRQVYVSLPRGVHSSVATATVVVNLKPVDVSTSIQVGVLPEGVAPGLRVQTQQAFVLVTVVGPLSRVTGAARGMKAVVNLAGYGAGTYQLTPTVQAPTGLSIENVYPSLVTVTLS